MRSDPRASRGTALSYFVLPSGNDGVEVARMNRRGLASYYDPGTQSWINDPLLASEILSDSHWRPAEPEHLPDGVVLPDVAPEPPARQKRRRDALGRHSAPKQA